MDIEKKFGTHKWDMMVNLSILSIIIVDIWCVLKGIVGPRYEDTEDTFYTMLAAEMIDNTLDTPQRTRGCTLPIRNITGPLSTLETLDGRVSTGIGVHLTSTKKRRCMKGEITNFMQQDW